MGGAESKPGDEIGSRSSGPCDLLTKQESSEQVVRRHFGPDFEPSAEERVGVKTQPRIVFDNLSSHRVSYWAIEKSKARTSANLKHLLSVMEVQLKLGNNDDNNASQTASGQDTRETKETTDDAREDAGFLMRDKRIEPGAESPHPIEVQFSQDGEDLRVFGYFEEDGEWKMFKDKVYSICWYRKVFTLTACDASITPYTKGRNANVPDIAP